MHRNGNHQQNERQPTEWENIFANALNKGLMSKFYKELLKLKTKKTNHPTENGKAPFRHSFKEDVQMVNRYVKRCAMAQIREMHIKTTMRHHLTPVRTAIINKTTNAGKNMEKREPSHTVGGNADWCSCCGKLYGISSKNSKCNCLTTQGFHFWEYIRRNLKH